jgi:hypothetical protein
MGSDGRTSIPRGVNDDARGWRTLLLAGGSAMLVLAVAALIGGALGVVGSAANHRPLTISAAAVAGSTRVGARQRQYWTTSTPAGLRADNGSQGLRTTFGRTGLHLTAPGGRVTLMLAGIGRGTRLQPVPTAGVTANANRVTYARPGLTESYANGPLGVEQGLVLATRPAASRAGALNLAYRLRGYARTSLANGVLSFLSLRGDVLLRYGGLRVTDATGRALPSRFGLDGSYLMIQLDDAQAHYPLRVDPLIQGPLAARSAAMPVSALVVNNATGLTLSVTPLRSDGNPYGTADEGVGNPLVARVTIANPTAYSFSTVTPSVPVSVTPPAALTPTGPPTPATPAGGYTLAPNDSVHFDVPYRITQSGQATISDTVTYKYTDFPDSPAGPSTGQTTAPLGFKVSGMTSGRVCSSTSCQQSALKGQTVVAAGTAADGTSITRTTTTAADGTFAFGVPGGTFTVAPEGDGWDPPFQQSPVSSDLSGVNFVKCIAPGGTAASSDAVKAAGTEPCRPTKVTMFCEYRPKSFVSFTKISTQSCFVSVIDQGPLPHRTPTGIVRFRAINPGFIIGIIQPNPCQLTASISLGVAECSVTLDPGTNSKVGDTLGVIGTYGDSTNTFKSSEVSYTSKYTPMLDPSNKSTAADAEAHLIAITATSGAIGLRAFPPALGVSATSAVLAVPFHYLQLPSEPPDPRYADVYRPRITHAAKRGPSRLAAAIRALTQTDLAIEGWAGAEWNALNRSIVARLKNNRAAFVTQMLAASHDERQLAGLVVKLPGELAAIKRLSSKQLQHASLRLTSADLKRLKQQLSHPSRAQQQFDKSVGLTPSLVATEVKATTRHLSGQGLSGGVFAHLAAIMAREAKLAPFLNRVAAIHAGMAQQYG